MDEKPGDVLTIEELSAYPKIPKSRLYKLVREGKVPCQKIGRHRRFLKVAIDRWLEDLPATPSAAQAGLVLLDNTEMLFDIHLKQDPLCLFQRLSRNNTVVAAWNRSIVDGRIIIGGCA